MSTMASLRVVGDEDRAPKPRPSTLAWQARREGLLDPQSFPALLLGTFKVTSDGAKRQALLALAYEADTMRPELVGELLAEITGTTDAATAAMFATVREIVAELHQLSEIHRTKTPEGRLLTGDLAHTLYQLVPDFHQLEGTSTP